MTGRARLVLLAAVAAGIFLSSLAIAMNKGGGGSGELLPPLPDRAEPAPAPEPSTVGVHSGHDGHDHTEDKLYLPTPSAAASLAGSPASVVRRFARAWANRNTVLTPAVRREMIGLSSGAWASIVSKEATLALPTIDGVGVEGDMVMMKLEPVAPGSKTAVVVTREHFYDLDGALSPPRYELYLARLDRVAPGGYAITAWEPLQ